MVTIQFAFFAPITYAELRNQVSDRTVQRGCRHFIPWPGRMPIPAFAPTVVSEGGPMTEKSCTIAAAEDQDPIETIHLHPEPPVRDHQEAMTLARQEAERRYEEFMLISWYDRDRDIESPPNSTECAGDCEKDGYIHYARSHNARLKVDIDNGRFIFFFTPVEWE